MDAGSSKCAVFNQPTDPLYYTVGPPMAGSPASANAPVGQLKNISVFSPHTPLEMDSSVATAWMKTYCG